MKPHPKLRKTIKWSGAALTVLLIVVWVASAWWALNWTSASRFHVLVAFGRVVIDDRTQDSTVRVVAGWQAGRIPDSGLAWGFIYDRTFPPSPIWWQLGVPIWAAVALSALVTLVAWRLDVLARRRARLNLCPNCHYDRTGISQDAKCPECGTTSESG